VAALPAVATVCAGAAGFSFVIAGSARLPIAAEPPTSAATPRTTASAIACSQLDVGRGDHTVHEQDGDAPATTLTALSTGAAAAAATATAAATTPVVAGAGAMGGPTPGATATSAPITAATTITPVG
jgi:hypothetical protein